MTKARIDKITKDSLVIMIESPDEMLIEQLAMKMFNNGTSKVNICKKLNVDSEKFDQLIIKKFGDDIRILAINMFLKGFMKKRICNDLNIKKINLDVWLNTYYEKDERMSKSEIPTVQEGFSRWVTKIIEREMQLKKKNERSGG